MLLLFFKHKNNHKQKSNQTNQTISWFSVENKCNQEIQKKWKILTIWKKENGGEMDSRLSGATIHGWPKMWGVVAAADSSTCWHDLELCVCAWFRCLSDVITLILLFGSLTFSFLCLCSRFGLIFCCWCWIYVWLLSRFTWRDLWCVVVVVIHESCSVLVVSSTAFSWWRKLRLLLLLNGVAVHFFLAMRGCTFFSFHLENERCERRDYMCFMGFIFRGLCWFELEQGWWRVCVESAWCYDGEWWFYMGCWSSIKGGSKHSGFSCIGMVLRRVEREGGWKLGFDYREKWRRSYVVLGG